MNNIPVSQTNLGGNKVSDLVEALLKLDQDIKVDVQNVRVEHGMLALDEQRFIDKFNYECAIDMLSLEDLIERYQDSTKALEKHREKLSDIRKLLDE